MSHLHRRIFKLYLMGQDGLPLTPGQRAELRTHLATCPACQTDQMLLRALQAPSGWHSTPAPISTQAVLAAAGRQVRMRRTSRSMQVVALLALAVLALFLTHWALTHLTPKPAGLPVRRPTPTEALPTLVATQEALEAFPAEPLYTGIIAGEGLWSPEGETYFAPVLQPAGSPGSDRRITTLHFINTHTGQDCPSEQTFLGNQGSQNAAWLDEDHLLYITRTGKALVFSPCQPEVEDISDHFREPLLQVAVSRLPRHTASPAATLLMSSNAYWLLSSSSLEARLVEDISPSTSGPESRTSGVDQSFQSLSRQDSFALHPSGRQIAILQPIPGELDRSQLSLLSLESGMVVRSFVLAAGSEDRALHLEWMGPDQLFVWLFQPGGPLLVELASDPPSQTQVIPDLLGLEIDYPNQIYSAGAFYDPDSQNMHFVLHVDLTTDNNVYLYHGENGQVEQLPGDQPRLLIFPDGQLLPLVLFQDRPPDQDAFELFWVDRPEQAPTQWMVSGHLPRGYPTLQVDQIPGQESLLLSSSNGISQVSLPDGEAEAFWPLGSGEDGSPPSISVSPDGRAMIVTLYPSQTSSSGQPHQPVHWIKLDQPVP